MKNTTKTTSSNKALTIIGIVLCVVLVPILIVNCTLIIKSFINKDEVPDFGGLLPMIVLSPSMEPDILEGDLIFCMTVDPEEIEVGQVISYFDPAGNGTMVVTHKVDEIIEKDGKLYFKTYGINNKKADGSFDMDPTPVPADKLVGRYTGVRLPAIGDFAMFMQTPAGLILCVAVPIVALIAYDLIRRKKMDKTNDDDVAALKAELEQLKAMQNADAMQNAQGTMQNDSSDGFKPLEDEDKQSD